ncbi:MAG: prepilin peptidase [Myxococcales bacterium]|nr:prepilin peptidase [Myxococcales bacterium]
MSELFGQAPILWTGFVGLFGLVLGSFLNVVIHRWPRGESVVSPRSRCPSCGHEITAWENIPVLSYLALRGRCRGCRRPISPRYPLFELATGLLFAGITWRYGFSFMTPLFLIFAAALVTAGAIDFDEQIIPDEISLGGLMLGLVAVPVAHALDGGSWSAALRTAAVGAALGSGLLWLVGFAHARYCAARGRRFDHWPEGDEPFPTPGQADYWLWFPGLGLGDVKLLGMIGAFLGPVGVVYTILLSAIGGLLFGLAAAWITKSWDTPFGFGPAIAAGALLFLLMPELGYL